MAPSGTPSYTSFVDDQAEDYVESLIDFEDRHAKARRKEADKQGFPHLSPEAARMLEILVTVRDADRVLEVGTGLGYSSGFLARPLGDDGRLVTVEIDEDTAEQARTYLEKIGVLDRVDIRVGDARDVLPDLDPPFDLALIDADKEGYPDYLEEALGLVPPGGVICADNLFWHGQVFKWIGDDATKQVVDFGRSIGRDERLLSTILPLGDGLSVSVVVG